MPISLYTSTVGSYLQTLGVIDGILSKSRAHFTAHDEDPDEIIGVRLYPDMFSFERQVKAVSFLSIGEIHSAQAGVFVPPAATPSLDYDGLIELTQNTLKDLRSVAPEDVEKLQGQPVEFKIGDTSPHFLTEDFFLTFALPNFYFHATTTYNLLRMKGVPLGKTDFLGQM